MRNGLFISYRRADTEWQADFVHDRCRRAYKWRKVFLDSDAIQGGDDFVDVIESALSASSVCLVLIGPEWSRRKGAADSLLERPNDAVTLELRLALRYGLRVLPVVLDGGRMPTAQELPYDIRYFAGLHALKLRSSDRITDIEYIIANARTPVSQLVRDPSVLGMMALVGLASISMTVLWAVPVLQQRALERAQATLTDARSGTATSEATAAALRTKSKAGVLADSDLTRLDLQGQSLAKTDLPGSDLRGSTLDGSNWDQADMDGTKLDFVGASDASLRGASLDRSEHFGTDYEGAHLEGASFARADLTYARLFSANLSNANFRNANLTYADLRQASVGGADFTGAILNGASLSGAKGLESAIFSGTSVTNTAGLARDLTDEQVCGYFFERTQGDGLHFPSTLTSSDHRFYLSPCPSRDEAMLPIGASLNEVSYSPMKTLKIRRPRGLGERALEERALASYATVRMRDFATPSTDQDQAYREHLEALVKAMPLADLPASVCLGNDYFSTRLLASYSEGSNYVDGLRLYEVPEEIITSARRQRELEEGRKRGIDVFDSAVFPLGKVHPASQEVDERYQLVPPLRLGPRTVAAYDAWKSAVSGRVRLAICFQARSQKARGVAGYHQRSKHPPSRSVGTESAWAFLRDSDPAPTLVTTLRGGIVTAFFLDGGLPPALVDASFGHRVNNVKPPLEESELLKLTLAVDRVELMLESTLMLVYAKVTSTEREQVWECSGRVAPGFKLATECR
ncbi:MAG: pentapeptide repeat-containing protein [Pseudomonadota bacterium]